MRKKYRNNLKFGVSTALLSGIFWGMDTVLTGVILAMSPFVSTAQAIAIAPIVGAFLHDFSSAFWMTILSIIRKDFMHTARLLWTRSGRFVILAALFGGPIGMMAYMFAITNIGASYTASISAMYPAAGAFFSYVFLHIKLTKKGWFIFKYPIDNYFGIYSGRCPGEKLCPWLCCCPYNRCSLVA